MNVMSSCSPIPETLIQLLQGMVHTQHRQPCQPPSGRVAAIHPSYFRQTLVSQSSHCAARLRAQGNPRAASSVVQEVDVSDHILGSSDIRAALSLTVRTISAASSGAPTCSFSSVRRILNVLLDHTAFDRLHNTSACAAGRHLRGHSCCISCPSSGFGSCSLVERSSPRSQA